MNESSLHKNHNNTIQSTRIPRCLRTIVYWVLLLELATSMHAQQGLLPLPGGVPLLRLPPIRVPSEFRPAGSDGAQSLEEPIREQLRSRPLPDRRISVGAGGAGAEPADGDVGVSGTRTESGTRSAGPEQRARVKKYRQIMKTTALPSPGSRRLQAQTRIRVSVGSDINPATVEPGDWVHFAVETGESDFGSLDSMASMPTGAEVEAIVLKVRRPAAGNKGGVVFQPVYLVWPIGADAEVAVPIAAKLLKPSVNLDESPHEVGSKATTIASAFGQLTFGINGYFTAGAVATLGATYLSKMQQNAPSYCLGVLKEGTLGDIVLTKTRYF